MFVEYEVNGNKQSGERSEERNWPLKDFEIIFNYKLKSKQVRFN